MECFCSFADRRQFLLRQCHRCRVNGSDTILQLILCHVAHRLYGSVTEIDSCATMKMNIDQSRDHITARCVNLLSIAGICCEKAAICRYFLLNEFSIFKYFAVYNLHFDFPPCLVLCSYDSQNSLSFFLNFHFKILVMESQVSHTKTQKYTKNAQESTC